MCACVHVRVRMCWETVANLATRAGAVYMGASRLLAFLRIDDPVDAAPVHLANGLWGVLAVGAFASRNRVQQAYFPTGDFRVQQYGFIMGV